MNSINDIKEYFLNLPEVKRIKELEHYIDNNENINNQLARIKDIQKQMVNSKEYNQMNQYIELKHKYESAKEELLDFPFVEEYLELLEIVNNMLSTLTCEISDRIYKKINEQD